MDCRSESASDSVPPIPTSLDQLEYVATRIDENYRHSHIPAPILRHGAHKLRSHHRPPARVTSRKKPTAFHPGSRKLLGPNSIRKGSGLPCEQPQSNSGSCHRQVAPALWQSQIQPLVAPPCPLLL